MQGGPDERGGASTSVEPGALADVTEDFLFHLYRGGELLQDNRLHEAQDELESALRLRPHDARGQDLLAVVYFRLGLYPRAIAIYEELAREHARDAPVMLNLSLCYVKTGRPERAQTLLENLVIAHPENLRAWSYLGLVHERLGSFEEARIAFERAQQPAMTRRMDELRAAGTTREGDSGAQRSAASTAAAATDALAAPSDTFSDIDTEITLVGMPALPRLTSAPPPATSSSKPPLAPTRSAQPSPVEVQPTPAPALPSVRVTAPLARAPGGDELPSLRVLTDGARLVFPAEAGAALHPSGLVLCTVTSSIAARRSAIQHLAPGPGGLQVSRLPRRMRNRNIDDTLGGEDDPLLAIAGKGGVALLARQGERLLAFRMEHDFLFVRETALVAFESALTYENGGLAAFEGEAVALVQLRGRGAVVLGSRGPLVSALVTADHPTIFARTAVVGWAGRLLPRELSPDEAPLQGAQGLMAFAGEGTVLACAGVALNTA